MKKYVITHSLLLVKHYYPSLDDDSLAEIEYGLTGIYLTFTKLFVILLLASFFNIIHEVLIFMIVFNLIRTFSFGLHATKSWVCLLSSTLIFILIPILCNLIFFPLLFKWVIGILTIGFIFKNSPADTYKRPIINQSRRTFFKLFSTLIATLFVILSLCVTNNFYSNCFIFAPIVECFLISPMVYRFFHLPYDNYKAYLTGAS